MTERAIPMAAVGAAARAWVTRHAQPGSWTLEENLRAALEAAAPHMLARDEAKLAAIIALLDRFERVTKRMETSTETGGYAHEAVCKIRDILDSE